MVCKRDESQTIKIPVFEGFRVAKTWNRNKQRDKICIMKLRMKYLKLSTPILVIINYINQSLSFVVHWRLTEQLCISSARVTICLLHSGYQTFGFNSKFVASFRCVVESSLLRGGRPSSCIQGECFHSYFTDSR